MPNDKKRGTGLRWITVKGFELIPKKLIEQVDPPINSNMLYELGPLIGQSPYLVLGVFSPMQKTDADYGQVKGFMWGQINPLDNKIYINVLSVDEEYQGRGIVKEARGILDRIVKQKGLDGIVFTTKKPELFESAGAKPNGVIMMEV